MNDKDNFKVMKYSSLLPKWRTKITKRIPLFKTLVINKFIDTISLFSNPVILSTLNYTEYMTPNA